MKSFIPETRAVIGDDLNTLRERLGLGVGEACWLYGISMTKWMNIVNKAPKDPITNPSLALMIRSLSIHPDACPLPSTPSAQEIYDMINQGLRLEEPMDLKRLAIMFGCEGSSGYRWITKQGEISPVLERLFQVFRTLFKPIMGNGQIACAKFILEWEQMITQEAEERNLEAIWKTGRWTFGKDEEVDLTGKRPTKGEDLDALRERLGLSTQDACWLFGMSMTRWMTVAKKDWDKKAPNDPEKRGGAKLPLRNVSLAMLVRVLKKYPYASPIPAPVTVEEVFGMLQTIDENFDKKRLAIMFGCEASSGYRWMTHGNKIGPALERAFKVFTNLMAPHVDNGPSAKALELLGEWNHLVEIESEARGIDDIFHVGRWAKPEKIAAKQAEKEAKADKRRQEKAATRAAKAAARQAQVEADKAERRQAKIAAKAEQEGTEKSAKRDAAKVGNKLLTRVAKKATATT